MFTALIMDHTDFLSGDTAEKRKPLLLLLSGRCDGRNGVELPRRPPRWFPANAPPVASTKLPHLHLLANPFSGVIHSVFSPNHMWPAPHVSAYSKPRASPARCHYSTHQTSRPFHLFIFPPLALSLWEWWMFACRGRNNRNVYPTAHCPSFQKHSTVTPLDW